MQQKSKVAIETKHCCTRSTEQKSFITRSNFRSRSTAVHSAKEMKHKLLSAMGIGRNQNCTLQYQKCLSSLFSVPTPNRNYLAVLWSQRGKITRRKKIIGNIFLAAILLRETFATTSCCITLPEYIYFQILRLALRLQGLAFTRILNAGRHRKNETEVKHN